MSNKNTALAKYVLDLCDLSQSRYLSDIGHTSDTREEIYALRRDADRIKNFHARREKARGNVLGSAVWIIAGYNGLSHRKEFHPSLLLVMGGIVLTVGVVALGFDIKSVIKTAKEKKPYEGKLEEHFQAKITALSPAARQILQASSAMIERIQKAATPPKNSLFFPQG